VPKVMWAPFGYVSISTSSGRNFCIRSLFGVHDSSLESYRQGDSFWGINKGIQLSLRISVPKSLHLGPQNGPES
jgi:hypothetical protein